MFFDLLGSGRVKVQHGLEAKGVGGHLYPRASEPSIDNQGKWLQGRINKANLGTSREIWGLIDPSYQPIDWHVDFKSGYRWNEDTFFANIPYGHLPGVDIKVPWELSRAQHLPHLAYGYGLAQAGLSNKFSATSLALEFRNEILDFIATNPPQFGVNWKCPMDVAIRAANWLVGLDLFHAYGHEFDEGFYRVLHASLMDHGTFIKGHPEKASDFRGNHYLADVAGLAVIACYLADAKPEIMGWLKFGHQELIRECEYQFYPEGTNFEGATAYHRLSAEMVVFPTLLYMALPKAIHRQLADGPLFPDWYWDRIRAMGEFAIHIMKPRFQIVQFGDNDSGRFLKLHPCYRLDSSCEEDFLDFRHLVMAIDGLLGRTPTYEIKHGGLDYWVASQISNTAVNDQSNLLGAGQSLPTIKLESITTEWARVFVQDYHFDLPGLDPMTIEKHFYPEMGYFIWRSLNEFYLALRCGPAGQLNRGGHDHNDQLSIELHWRGSDLILDPGTYLYTPLPEMRNRFRSRALHWAPRPVSFAAERFEHGLFSFPSNHHHMAFIYANFFGFYIRQTETPFIRLIAIENGALIVRDLSDQPLARLPANQASDFSRAYGRITLA